MAMFGWDNAVNAGTLTATAAASGFGADQLKNPIGSPAVAWQTPAGTTSAGLTIVSASTVAWRVACLSRTNLTTSATIRVRVGAAATITSSPTYDSGVVTARVLAGIGQALHLMPSAVSALAMRIDLADSTNPDGFLNVPLAFAGAVSEASIAPESDTGVDMRQADTTTRAGVVFTDPLSRARNWQFRLAATRDEDLTWLDAYEAAAAARRNVLFVPRSDYTRASAETVFGLLTPGRRTFLNATGARRIWSATISERL